MDLSGQQLMVSMIEDTFTLPFPIGQIWKIYLFGKACIFFPVFEEYLYRDLAINWIKERQQNPNSTISKISRIVISGTVFGMAHAESSLGWLNIPVVTALTIMGVSLSALREYQGHTQSTLACHVTQNLIQCLKF